MLSYPNSFHMEAMDICSCKPRFFDTQIPDGALNLRPILHADFYHMWFNFFFLLLTQCMFTVEEKINNYITKIFFKKPLIAL